MLFGFYKKGHLLAVVILSALCRSVGVVGMQPAWQMDTPLNFQKALEVLGGQPTVFRLYARHYLPPAVVDRSCVRIDLLVRDLSAGNNEAINVNLYSYETIFNNKQVHDAAFVFFCKTYLRSERVVKRQEQIYWPQATKKKASSNDLLLQKLVLRIDSLEKVLQEKIHAPVKPPIGQQPPIQLFNSLFSKLNQIQQKQEELTEKIKDKTTEKPRPPKSAPILPILRPPYKIVPHMVPPQKNNLPTKQKSPLRPSSKEAFGNLSRDKKTCRRRKKKKNHCHRGEPQAPLIPSLNPSASHPLVKPVSKKKKPTASNTPQTKQVPKTRGDQTDKQSVRSKPSKACHPPVKPVSKKKKPAPQTKQLPKAHQVRGIAYRKKESMKREVGTRQKTCLQLGSMSNIYRYRDSALSFTKKKIHRLKKYLANWFKKDKLTYCLLPQAPPRPNKSNTYLLKSTSPNAGISSHSLTHSWYLLMRTLYTYIILACLAFWVIILVTRSSERVGLVAMGPTCTRASTPLDQTNTTNQVIDPAPALHLKASLLPFRLDVRKLIKEGEGNALQKNINKGPLAFGQPILLEHFLQEFAHDFYYDFSYKLLMFQFLSKYDAASPKIFSDVRESLMIYSERKPWLITPAMKQPRHMASICYKMDSYECTGAVAGLLIVQRYYLIDLFATFSGEERTVRHKAKEKRGQLTEQEQLVFKRMQKKYYMPSKEIRTFEGKRFPKMTQLMMWYAHFSPLLYRLKRTLVPPFNSIFENILYNSCHLRLSSNGIWYKPPFADFSFFIQKNRIEAVDRVSGNRWQLAGR